MDFLASHWGDIASLTGVIVSVIGLGWAVIEARGARSAARAAEEAAEQVKIEAIDNIELHLLVVDIERAVDLIQRLKLLHSIDRWEAALEQYQVLRALTSAIIARSPAEENHRREQLVGARALIRAMEDYVEHRRAQELGTEAKARLGQQLNHIQSDLEDMANTISFGGHKGGAR